jgi:hypothetical protein
VLVVPVVQHLADRTTSRCNRPRRSPTINVRGGPFLPSSRGGPVMRVLLVPDKTVTNRACLRPDAGVFPEMTIPRSQRRSRSPQSAPSHHDHKVFTPARPRDR